MNHEQWLRLDELFEATRQQPHDARAAFVTRACGADDELRTEALSLLAAVDQSGEFMAKPAINRLAEEIGRAGSSLSPWTTVSACGRRPRP